jgi:hypothetical protein
MFSNDDGRACFSMDDVPARRFGLIVPDNIPAHADIATGFEFRAAADCSF